MTGAERLIGKLCEDVRTSIVSARDVSVKAKTEGKRLPECPAAVAKAVREIRKLRPRIAAAQRVITDAGFEFRESNGDEDESELNVPYSVRTKVTNKIHISADALFRRLNKMQNGAKVAVMGLSQLAAKPTLEALQRDLKALETEIAKL